MCIQPVLQYQGQGQPESRLCSKGRSALGLVSCVLTPHVDHNLAHAVHSKHSSFTGCCSGSHRTIGPWPCRALTALILNKSATSERPSTLPSHVLRVSQQSDTHTHTHTARSGAGAQSSYTRQGGVDISGGLTSCQAPAAWSGPCQHTLREACRAGVGAAGPGGGSSACQQRRPAGQAGTAAAVGCSRPSRSCPACAQQAAGATPAPLCVRPWRALCGPCSLWGQGCRQHRRPTAKQPVCQRSLDSRARVPRLQHDVELGHMAACPAARAECWVPDAGHGAQRKLDLGMKSVEIFRARPRPVQSHSWTGIGGRSKRCPALPSASHNIPSRSAADNTAWAS